jgi:hypothetical protein
MSTLSDRGQEIFEHFKEPSEKNKFTGKGVAKHFTKKATRDLEKCGLLINRCSDGNITIPNLNFLQSFTKMDKFHLYSINGGTPAIALLHRNDHEVRRMHLEQFVGGLVLKTKDPLFPCIKHVILEGHLGCGLINDELDFDIFDSHDGLASTTEWLIGIFQKFGRDPQRAEELLMRMHNLSSLKPDTREIIYDRIKWGAINFLPLMYTSRNEKVEDDVKTVHRAYELDLPLWSVHRSELMEITYDILGKSLPHDHVSKRAPMEMALSA